MDSTGYTDTDIHVLSCIYILYFWAYTVRWLWLWHLELWTVTSVSIDGGVYTYRCDTSGNIGHAGANMFLLVWLCVLYMYLYSSCCIHVCLCCKRLVQWPIIPQCGMYTSCLILWSHLSTDVLVSFAIMNNYCNSYILMTLYMTLSSLFIVFNVECSWINFPTTALRRMTNPSTEVPCPAIETSVFFPIFKVWDFSSLTGIFFAWPGLNLPASVVFSAHNSIWISLPFPEVVQPRGKTLWESEMGRNPEKKKGPLVSGYVLVIASSLVTDDVFQWISVIFTS